MPGNSQGIVVSIQAKIEGWQSQIKAIQDALKNIKAGTGISKDLTKDLKQVESLVNNLGKNINQRLTSDSQITGFTDKLREVDEIFAHMGQRMTSISFADMDPSYITNNFKDLLTAIEQANNALSGGMTNSFQNAIAESTNLQKAFDKLGIDPSKMGAEELKKLLETKSSDLEKALIKANNELKNLQHNAAEARKIMSDMESAKILEISDTKATAKNLIGDTTKLGHTEIDPAKLQEFATQIDNILVNGGARLEQKLKEKREQVDQAIKQLINAQTVEEARQKLQEIEDIFASVRAKSEFTIKVDKIKDEELTSWIPDPTAVQNKLSQIQAVLNDYKIDPKTLKNINMEDLIKSGNFDKLADEIDKVLKKAQVAAEKDVEKIRATVQKLETTEHDKLGEINSTSAIKYNIDQGLDKWDGMIQKIQQENAALREEVEKLKAQLAERAIANVKTLGGKTAASSAQGIQDSTNAAKAYEAQLGRVKSAEQALGKLQGVVQRWFSIYAVIRMVNNAIHSMIDTIKELDKTITNIAIVTDMSQDDLWKQMPKYTQMARDYASSIAGVYEVSQLYYQQGLEMAEVMSLTEATLKMARISGLGYADATDYMTNAVRSFKMEMSEATTVVDVYSAVAASSATSVTELATAMSKTASSAEAVGSSFQNTTAMMAVMIEATRESPENIGSALKSIISRYGELKKNMTGTDAEGEDYSLNKVDTALQSIGISIHDVNGEFRDFDDVIMELADKWDTVDKNTQRYIATVMAGNRQQSRFLALVSSSDRLRELADEAANSEDASQLQFLKSLDSIDSKVQQLQTSIQALYTNSGLEQTYKEILDFANRVMTTFDNISNNQGLLGVASKIATSFIPLAYLVSNIFNTIKLKAQLSQQQITANMELESAKRILQQKKEAYDAAEAGEEALAAHEAMEVAKTKVTEAETRKRELTNERILGKNGIGRGRTAGMGITAAGMIANTIAASMDVNENRQLKAGLTGLGGILSGVGTGMMIGGVPGALMGIVTALPSVMESIGMWSESVEDTIKKLETNITEANNQRIKSRDELKTLDDYKKKYDELNKSQYESNETKQEFIDLQNEIAEKYPELISRMDEEGNYTVNLTDGYKQLAAAKREAYKSDLINTMGAEIASLNNIDYVLKNVYGHTSLTNQKTLLGISTDNYEGLLDIDYSKTADAIDALTSKIWNTEGINNQNYNIAKRLFNKNQNFDTVSGPLTFTYTDMGDELSKESSSILNDIYLSFVDSMKEGLDLNSAKAQVKQNFDSQYAQLIDNFDSNFYKELQLRYNIPSYQKDLVNNRLNAYTTEYINLIADSADAVFGTESGSLEKRFAKEQLSNEWNVQYDKLIERQNLGEDIDWSEEINNFYQSHEEFWYNIQLESEVLSGMDSAAREFYDSMGQHTLSEINELFKLKDTTDLEGSELEAAEQFNKLQEARRAFFNGIFTKDYQAIITNYNKWLESDNVTEFKIKDFSQLIGPDFLNGIQEKYNTILNSTVSSGTKQSQIDLLNQIYDVATSENISTKERNSILTALHGADLFSITGIYDAIEAIEGLQLGNNGKIITDALDNLSELISVNLTTEIGNLLNNYGSQIESFTKDLSKASKGLDFKSAAELADKLKLNLSDFNQIDDKFYLKDLTNLQDYYIQEDKKYQQALKDHIQQKKDLYEATTEVPVIETASEYFDLEAYINSEDEESRKLMYEYWEDEIKSISPTWTFKNLEKYRANRSEYNRLNWINEDQFKQLSKEYSFETGTKEFNLNEILKNNNYNLEAIENELTNEWADILENANIDSSVLLSDIKSYIDNGDFSQTLAEYTANESYKLLDSVTEAEQQAVQYLIASTQLSAGDIEGFLRTAGVYKTAGDFYMGGNTLSQAQEEADLYNQTLTNAIASGDISNLPEELQQYAKLIYDSYNKISSNIFNSAITALEKGTDAAIEVNALNADKLIESGLVQRSDIYDEEGNLTTSMVIIPYEQIKNMTDAEFDNFLNATATSYEDRVKAIGIRMSKDKPDIKSSSEKVNDDLKKISYDEITSMWHDMGLLDKDNVSQERINQLMEEWGLQYDAYGNIIGDATLIDKEIENLLQQYISGKISREEWVKQKYKLEQLKEDIVSESDQTKGKALSDVIDNYTSVSSEQFADLMGAFADLTLEQRTALESTFTLNSDGTRTFDVTKFRKLVANGIIPLNSAVLKIAEESLEKQIDDARSALTNATKLVTSGTTSQVEIQKWIDTVKELDILEGAGVEDVFEYDELLDAWTLKPEILHEYAQKQAEALGLQDEELTKFIESQTLKPLAEAVDISSYLKSSNQDGQAADTLRKQLKDWATQHWHGVEPDDTTLDGWINTIKTGGQAAVDLALEIATDAGKELSTDEMQQIYAPLVQKYVNLANEIPNLVVGQYIGKGDLRSILEEAGIVDKSTGLVKQVTDMTEAYLAIYNSMSEAAGNTTADLNSIYAKYLAAEDQKNIDLLDALQNASGMTYDALGSLLAKYNVDLETFINDQNGKSIERTGFGKIRILDFDKFMEAANLSDLDMNDPEFMKAYNDWVDARIEWENAEKQRMDDAVEEIKNLGDAKASDKLNVSHLEAELGDSLAIVALSYSAELKDGLLTLTDKTDIPGLMSALADEAAKQGKLIPEQIAELADAVRDLLAQITSLIQGGIKGTLSHVDAQQLQSWADLHQLGELDFTETAEGLKLSQQSAIQLYNALNRVDKLQGSLVFKELNDSLKETNENYNSVSSIMNHIKDLDNKIADEKTSDARKQQYEEELSLAKEILAVRSTSEDDSFNFMSNKIPGAQNNPLNYYENWGKAFKSIKEAYKVGKKGQRGFMDYTDFYNIITEINNVAGQMGSIIPVGKDIEGNAYKLDGSLEAAARLIEAGAASLTSVDAGDIKVNIGKLGINLKDGATDMEKGIHEGVTAMANAQVDALDAMIAMLELIVSMEELGDIDVDSNGIEWEELFNLDEQGNVESFSKGLTDWIDYCRKQIDSGNEDLKKGLESLKLNTQDGMKSLYDIFIGKDAWQPDDFNNKIDQNFKKLLPAMMNAMRKAAESNDWDPDHIAESMQSILNESGLGNFEGQFAFDIGDTTFVIKNGLIVKAVEWSSAEVQAALKDYMKTSGKNEEEAKQAILASVQDYLNGKGAGGGGGNDKNAVDLKTIIRVRHGTLIKNDKDGKGDYLEGPDGKKYHEGIDSEKSGWEALIQKIVLEDQGIDPANIKTDLDGGTSTATVTYGKKIKSKFKVTVDKDGKANWNIEPGDDPEFSGFKGNYTTQEDLLKGMYNFLAQQKTKTGQDNSAIGENGNLLSYEQWVWAKYGIHVRVKPEVIKGDEVVEDPTNDPEVRETINSLLKSQKPIPYKSDGSGHIIVELENGVQIKLNEEDVTVNGKVNQDALARQLQQLLGIDTNLSDTITQGVTAAFAAIPEALSEIKSDSLEAVANAIQRIAISSAALLITLPFVSAALNNLKININTDEFKGETIGQQIVSAIQTYLDSNPLKLKFDTGYDSSGSEAPDSGNFTFNKPEKAWVKGMDTLVSNTSTKFKQISDVAKIDTNPIITFGREVKDIDPTNIERTAEATKEFKDDKIFAAVDALSKIEPKPIKEAAEALASVKSENGKAMKDGSDGLSQVTTENGTAMKNAADALASVVADNGTAVQTAIEAINTVSTEGLEGVLSTLKSALGEIKDAADAITNTDAGQIEIAAAAISGASVPELSGSLAISYQFGGGAAKGTIGNFAQAKGNTALSKGTTSTLMGELGPELVVSDGRYFLAGQAGAEFVDLANDAIVFNHLQTKRLMQQGAINGRGQAFTNERLATSFAKGNAGTALDKGNFWQNAFNQAQIYVLAGVMARKMLAGVTFSASPEGETFSPIIEPGAAGARGTVKGGPAQASAKAALAALKQLRAQWKALAGMGAKDFAGLGGSGGSGGGGNNDNKLDMAFVKDLELWYNWLQRIAVLEEKINYEEARRNEISSSFAPNGKEYYNSQKQTLDMLKEQAAVHQSLVESQQKYFDERRAKMNDSHNPFSQLYTFDEYGQLKYNNPNFESFMKLVGRDSETGKANMTAKEQYNEILRMDPQFAKYMEYDNSGNKIDKSEEGWEEKAVQAFWDKIDADQAEMQDLHNSIEEHKQAVLEAQEQANEILHEMEDNQLELENKVLSAIEESRQREIDELQKQRDALEQSSQALIDGLSEQLQKERDMYSRNEGQKELTGLQRQLAILQRSGGSASQIASLQKEISQKQQDAYFEAQQAQIDALQEASDKQLARLDKQIDLMTETLEYQKLYGMLWGEVYEVMAKSPTEIADYIRQNTENYWGQSTLQLTKTMRDDLFSAEQYKAMADDIGGLEYLVREYTEDAIKKKKEEEQRRAEEQKRKEEEERRKKEEEERRKKEEEERKKREAEQQKPKPSSGSGGGSSSPSGATTYISNNNYTHGVYVGGVKVRDEPHVLRGNMCILCERRVVYNAQGNAFAKGALLGELGPEAWVAGGKFHIAGQAGAEMVDLPDDAIVFNHQQTANLLRTGHAFGRGKALNTDKAIGNDQRESAIKAFWNQVDSDRARIPSLASMIRGQELSAGVLSTIGQGTSGNPIIINGASVNMNVSKIANDYDAERAGEKALEKMISIARKTQAQNRVGR